MWNLDCRSCACRWLRRPTLRPRSSTARSRPAGCKTGRRTRSCWRRPTVRHRFLRANCYRSSCLRQATSDAGKPLLELVDGSVLPLAEYSANGNTAGARLQPPSPADPQTLSLPVEKVHAVRLQPHRCGCAAAVARDSQARRPERLDRRLEARREEPRPSGMRARRSHRHGSGIRARRQDDPRAAQQGCRLDLLS